MKPLSFAAASTLLILSAVRMAGAQLIPRTPLSKPATISKPEFESELSVKFRDDLKVRPVGGSVTSAVNADLSAVLAVRAQYGLTFAPSSDLPQADLDFLETRAAQMSGVGQPDLAGMMQVLGPAATIEAAARDLLALWETEWVEFEMLDPDPPCMDLYPSTPPYFAPGNVWDSYHYEHPDPGLNMTCAWTYGGRGQDAQISDCEYGFMRVPNAPPPSTVHEDLCNVNSPYPASCLHGGHQDRANHGLAVLGMMFALDSEYGWTGLVPDATARFYSEWSGCSSSRGQAIERGARDSLPGDIILLEMQTTVSGQPQNAYVPAEIALGVWARTRNATDQGIIVVAAAGNGGVDLDRTDVPQYNEYRSRNLLNGDTRAILVGAGTPDSNHDRLPFSTFGQRINVQAWGHSVFTLGYIDTVVTTNPDPLQSYTAGFAGTSSATAMVAGAAAALQSVRSSHGLEKLTPLEMRQLLIETGIPQGAVTTAQHIGPFPNLGKAILQLGIGALDCEANGLPDECESLRGACCLGTTCSINTQCWCVSQGGTFTGIETTCQDCNGNGVPDVCQSPVGACCVGTTCTAGAQTCCSSQGGSFKGAGTTCQDDCNANAIADVCESTIGACCVGTVCAVRFLTCCNAEGGAFKGANTDCQDCTFNGVPDACELPSVAKGACCLTEDGPCELRTWECCELDGGWYFGDGSTCHPWTCGQIMGPSGP